jgi:DNA-binding NarL/FixJ family response regulator
LAVRVVVVDDTEHVRRMLVEMLTIDDFDVVGQAGDGIEAVEVVERATPDVVIMDYNMPRVDGLGASRRILDVRPHQPIILYTAYLDEALRQEASDAGITVCLHKTEGLGRLERHVADLARVIGRV